MSIAMRALPTPRYGSVAELSSYVGVSSKTIRRLIAAGRVPAYKVGRRVLIAFEDLDRHVQEASAMASAPTRGTVESGTGRLRSLSEEERRARTEALSRAFDEMGQITDETDTDENWREVFRGIDQGRPHRPLFEGMY